MTRGTKNDDKHQKNTNLLFPPSKWTFTLTKHSRPFIFLIAAEQAESDLLPDYYALQQLYPLDAC